MRRAATAGSGARTGRRVEPTIALINIIFLMLVFFLVAGTLARPLDRELKLVSAQELAHRAPPDALVAFADGRLTFRGDDTSPDAYVAEVAAASPVPDGNGPAVRIVPDRNLPATDLVRLIAELRAAGAASVFVVTERALR